MHVQCSPPIQVWNGPLHYQWYVPDLHWRTGDWECVGHRGVHRHRHCCTQFDRSPEMPVEWWLGTSSEPQCARVLVMSVFEVLDLDAVDEVDELQLVVPGLDPLRPHLRVLERLNDILLGVPR